MIHRLESFIKLVERPININSDKNSVADSYLALKLLSRMIQYVIQVNTETNNEVKCVIKIT